jgi:TPR repeat protein
MRRGLLALALLLPILHGCGGRDARFEIGAEAYSSGDFATALETWRPLAEQGHAAAQYQLGVLYQEGHGVAQDDGQALRWFRASADAGTGEAMIRLGEMYFHGRGVEPDVVEAYVWVARAEKRDTATAAQILRGLVQHMSAEQIAEAESRIDR